MKTGLVTFYHIHHYGAALQAAATQRAVESLGGSCEIIDYYVNQNNDLFRAPTGLGSAAADAHTALHYKPLKTRYERFEDFSRRQLHISPHRFESFAELRSAELPYDLILSGSDQIWNPTIFPDGHFDPVFFGAFSDRRKIAYAPSFGVPRIPDGMEEELRRYLARFSHLSVRESQGAVIVRELTGRDAPVVLDPTLLPSREDWAQMASSHACTGKGYILCYCISAPGPLEPYIRRLAEETGLPVVQLCGTRRKVHPKARCVLDAGPAEFLGLFRDASFVCTNSFHGTVFSVQFQKPFFTAVSPRELAAPETSRTFSLLSRLGLAERIVGKGDAADLKTPVDWAAAERRLLAARRSSLRYLEAALRNEEYREESPAPPPAEAPSPVLADQTHCTGCTACAAVCPKDAISMARDREGFSRPAVDPEKCVRCGRCTAVCPILHPLEQKPLPAAFAAWNRDDAIRRDSTSGGVFTALAEFILESGGVVFGAAFDSRQHLRHTACFCKEDLWRLRGAKYVQSDLAGTFRTVKACLESRQVLFSGTPCQVDGLYRYLGGRPENLTTCDLVCHGVPSPGVWEDTARLLAKRKGLQAVRFRNKVTGWKDSHFTAVYDDGSVTSAPLFRTEYGHAFGRALFLRPSCYRCPYASMTRPGDFTLGDFWGLNPDELPEQQRWGVSLLLVNTAHGSHIFDQLPLGRQAFPVERAIAGNPRLASPTACPPDRAAFFAAYALEPFDAVRRRFLTLPPLPVRAAGKLLSPEIKAKIRKKLG
nr:polysaccharide pyruvyl transferase family protein [uncultured Oscillibacter sp.]